MSNLWDQSAVIGHPPEMKDWPSNDGGHYPEIASDVKIEAFVSVDGGCEQPTRIGTGSWLLKHSHVGHDAQVGSYVTIATGAVVGGYCVIGDGVRIGLNATILPFRSVGAGAHVGAGAVVTRDVPAGMTVVGNPARMLSDNERDVRPFSHRERVA